MPELPEVQTVVSQLGRKIVGKRFSGFSSTWLKQVSPKPVVLARRIGGAVVLGVRRFGKHIVIDLDSGDSLVIHLKMTGHLLWKTEKNRESAAFTKDQINGYIRHVFRFADGDTLEFSDLRKFGWVKLVPTKSVERLTHIALLGVDALSPTLDAAVFGALLARKKGSRIGVVLLDQALLSGIGNIYRSEALFRAGIRPTRMVSRLTRAEKERLLTNIKEVLREALRLRGTSDGDFRDTSGRPGKFQENLFVYGHEGKECKRCGTIISREKLGARSAFWCSRCQR